MDIINKTQSLLNKNLIDANINVYFLLDDKEYEVDQFKIGFSQHKDFKGEPQSETQGGQLMITLTQLLPESFYSWVIENNKFKDGSILFRSGDSATVVKIEFFRGRCINISRRITIGKGVQSVLVLSPEIVKVNDFEHDNFWTK